MNAILYRASVMRDGMLTLHTIHWTIPSLRVTSVSHLLGKVTPGSISVLCTPGSPMYNAVRDDVTAPGLGFEMLHTCFALMG